MKSEYEEIGFTMIDFSNGSLIKLSPISVQTVDTKVKEILRDDEQILFAASGIRDNVALTNKRIIASNIKGLTGKKVDLTSIAYSRIAAFSIESAGTFDLDSELDIWVTGVGKVRFDFTRGTDLLAIGRIFNQYAL